MLLKQPFYQKLSLVGLFAEGRKAKIVPHTCSVLKICRCLLRFLKILLGMWGGGMGRSGNTDQCF